MTTTVAARTLPAGYTAAFSLYGTVTHLIPTSRVQAIRTFEQAGGLRALCGRRAPANGWSLLDLGEVLCERCLVGLEVRRPVAKPVVEEPVGKPLFIVRCIYRSGWDREEFKSSLASAKNLAREALKGAEQFDSWPANAGIDPLVRVDIITPEGTVITRSRS